MAKGDGAGEIPELISSDTRPFNQGPDIGEKQARFGVVFCALYSLGNWQRQPYCGYRRPWSQERGGRQCMTQPGVGIGIGEAERSHLD